jgi:hypothetical protein
MNATSRAFVKEEDEEILNVMADGALLKKREEWLRIQEAKLGRLLELPEGKVDGATRERWVREIRADIARVRRELGLPTKGE